MTPASPHKQIDAVANRQTKYIDQPNRDSASADAFPATYPDIVKTS